jgi:hypothetical protein
MGSILFLDSTRAVQQKQSRGNRGFLDGKRRRLWKIAIKINHCGFTKLPLRSAIPFRRDQTQGQCNASGYRCLSIG